MGKTAIAFSLLVIGWCLGVLSTVWIDNETEILTIVKKQTRS